MSAPFRLTQQMRPVSPLVMRILRGLADRRMRDLRRALANTSDRVLQDNLGLSDADIAALRDERLSRG